MLFAHALCMISPGVNALLLPSMARTPSRISSRSSSVSSRSSSVSSISSSFGSSNVGHERRRRPTSMLHMAARSGGGGATKIDRKTSQQTSTKPSYREEIEKDWRLILHDDTVHTIQQVCEILSATCPLCAGPRAYEVTLEVHMTGAGTVAVANKKIIDEYCKSLQVRCPCPSDHHTPIPSHPSHLTPTHLTSPHLNLPHRGGRPRG